MSSSVQFEIGNTRIDSPLFDAGVVLTFQSSGRWFLGSQRWVLRAEREDALLGAGFLLVTPCAAKGRVKTVLVERLLERFVSS